MNAFQSCPNTTDAVALYLPQQLYLKPTARLCINVQLPTQKMIGKSVSNWELMDQLRSLIRPDEFTHLKVIKTTAETIRFEAEVEHKNLLFRVLSKIDRKTIKLQDISDVLKVKGAEAKLDFPTKQTWDDFFANSKDMNEMKPGERPDTVHLSNLPTKWFVPYHMSHEDDDNIKPSEKIFYRIFEKFGHIRAIDIPICDPYRYRMKSHIAGMQTTTFDEAADFFEGYIQFRDFIGFTKCMDAFRNMKLMRKEHRHHAGADEEALSVNISVDFDRSKHLSEASIKRREIVRDRLVSKEQDKEERTKAAEEAEDEKKRAQRQKELDLKSEKQKRRMQREERRKAKILSQLKVQESDEINDKIAKEEKKLLQVQRKLEAIRIVEELFKRIVAKKECATSALKIRRDDEDELTKLKRTSELEVQEQKEKLDNALKGGVVLKTILGTQRHRSRSSSSNSSLERGRNSSTDKASTSKVVPVPSNHIQVHPSDMMFPANPAHHWNPYGGGRGGGHNGMYYEQHMAAMGLNRPVVSIRPDDEYYHPQVMHRLGRGGGGGGMMQWHGGGPKGGPGPSYQRRPRGVYSRGRGQMGRGFNRNHMNNCYYPPEVQDEYFRYFQKFLNHPDNIDQQLNGRGSRSKSRSRSRSRSYSRRSSRSRSRTRRRRSYSRSRSRNSRRSVSKSNRRSRSRTRSKDRARSRTKSKSRDRSRDKKSRSGERTTRGRYSRDRRSRTRSRSKSKSRQSHSPRSSRRSNTPAHGNNGNYAVPRTDKVSTHRSRSHSAKSVDSSAFIPPNRRRSTRSKSWSLPKEDNETGSAGKSRKRSWSKSPEK